MNGKELIDDIIDTVQQEETYPRTRVLGYLNQALLAIAGRVLLPGLADGAGTVTTVIDSNVAPLPADFHRELHQATADGTPVQISANAGIMLADDFNFDLTAGQVLGVTVMAGNLAYQYVPAVPVDIALRYYRKPTLLADSDTSVPDGLAGSHGMEDDIDLALISHVCARIFSKVEQGLEGAKIDTTYHTGQYEAAIARLTSGVDRARPRKAPPKVRFRWP